jgi:hypothetical protein
MKKTFRHIKTFILVIIAAVFFLAFLFVGPLLINYVFITETIGWDFDLAFSAGEMLQYYGAILGGLVTCFAIITTIHINNKNRRQDWQRQQFEHAYSLYHKLPEIMAKLELAAIHVEYSIHLPEDKLIETLDTMKESENILREHHFANNNYYNKEIEELLTKIINSSVKCQENVERYLQDIKHSGMNADPSYDSMENAFVELRDSIKSVKNKIMAEIKQFLSI